MVTEVQVADQRQQEVYAPSVSDRIQRILYRLDSGEWLIGGKLKSRDQFCVIGLFADESGLGEWRWDEPNGIECYFIDGVTTTDIAPPKVCELYGLAMYGNDVAIDISRLPEHIASLSKYISVGVDTFGSSMALLSGLNDRLAADLNIDTKTRNYILAEVIRSGAIFQDDTTKESTE